jgi:uncharacterized membrane protein YkvA (DUF1232 family)
MKEATMKTQLPATWKRRLNQLELETYAIYLAFKDPRVPWYAKVLVGCIVGYAFSPIDKLLSSIPVLAYLDHLILVPLGVVLIFKKMILPKVLADCRERARVAVDSRNTANRIPGSVLILVWLLFASIIIVSAKWAVRDWNLVLGQWFRWFTRMTFISESCAR